MLNITFRPTQQKTKPAVRALPWRLRKSPTVVAYHEAGHAVVAKCLGVAVRRATIIPEDGSAGHVLHTRMSRKMSEAIEFADRFSLSRLQAEKRVMVSLAGELAQRRFDPNSVHPDHGAGDREHIAHILERYAGCDSDGVIDMRKHYALLEEWTDQLLAQKWYLVQAVADALVERRTLSKQEIYDVILAADFQRFPGLKAVYTTPREASTQ